MASVVGFGFCAIAMAKKPCAKLCFGSGPPVGVNEKYFGYWNSVFTARPNRLRKVRLCCMMIGIAGAIMLVA